jgi:hypothetical protein
MYRYKKINLGNHKTIDEHRLIWKNTFGEIPEGYVVHHKDGDGKNNSLDNLELMTRLEHNRLHFKLNRSCKFCRCNNKLHAKGYCQKHYDQYRYWKKVLSV